MWGVLIDEKVEKVSLGQKNRLLCPFGPIFGVLVGHHSSPGWCNMGPIRRLHGEILAFFMAGHPISTVQTAKI